MPAIPIRHNCVELTHKCAVRGSSITNSSLDQKNPICSCSGTGLCAIKFIKLPVISTDILSTKFSLTVTTELHRELLILGCSALKLKFLTLPPRSVASCPGAGLDLRLLQYSTRSFKNPLSLAFENDGYFKRFLSA